MVPTVGATVDTAFLTPQLTLHISIYARHCAGQSVAFCLDMSYMPGSALTSSTILQCVVGGSRAHIGVLTEVHGAHLSRWTLKRADGRAACKGVKRCMHRHPALRLDTPTRQVIQSRDRLGHTTAAPVCARTLAKSVCGG